MSARALRAGRAASTGSAASGSRLATAAQNALSSSIRPTSPPGIVARRPVGGRQMVRRKEESAAWAAARADSSEP